MYVSTYPGYRNQMNFFVGKYSDVTDGAQKWEQYGDKTKTQKIF